MGVEYLVRALDTDSSVRVISDWKGVDKKPERQMEGGVEIGLISVQSPLHFVSCSWC